MVKFYLIGGNGSTKEWWEESLPYFKKYGAIPLELPGFGDNQDSRYQDISQLAEALYEMTEPGQKVLAVGISALVVLHLLTRHPGHFSKVFLLSPVGPFLWRRFFARLMSWTIFHRSAQFLLSRFPRFFRKKLSSKKWTQLQYQKIAKGYRQCRAFSALFKTVRAYNSLTLFEWINSPIEIIWGVRDKLLPIEHLAAWDTILPRAELSVSVHANWGHYPFIEDAENFVDYLEDPKPDFLAHTKAGRLHLAQLAGLPVPVHFKVSQKELPNLSQKIQQHPEVSSWAVRSSSFQEDKIDASHAGRFHTFLRVPSEEVQSRAEDLLNRGIDEIVIQHFIEPKISGVAFVRKLSSEIEWVEGHLEKLVDGRVMPHTIKISKLGEPWGQAPRELHKTGQNKFKGMDLLELNEFLNKVIAVFHYQASDIEWAWDGKQFYLFQIRPVTAYSWRRLASSANLDEILPKQVSQLMEYAQRRAAMSIPQIYGLWDSRVLEDAEPFTLSYQKASYLNADLFLSRLYDWGLPSKIFGKEIGGAVPSFGFHLARFLKSLPIFMRMLCFARKGLFKIEKKLKGFEQELLQLDVEAQSLDSEKADLFEKKILAWWLSYYTFLVQTNMLINAVITSSGGSWLLRSHTVYHQMNLTSHPHRVPFESDPASERKEKSFQSVKDFPHFPLWQKVWHYCALPGLGSRYFEIREWFRDNNMRLFHRLHFLLKESKFLRKYFSKIEGKRQISGSFWEDGYSGHFEEEVMSQTTAFVIYPGEVVGEIDHDIVVVDALEPGHFEIYRQAKAVIARSGGRLSHGSTLLRELQKPAAVIPNFKTQSKKVLLKFQGARPKYEEID